MQRMLDFDFLCGAWGSATGRIFRGEAFSGVINCGFFLIAMIDPNRTALVGQSCRRDGGGQRSGHPIGHFRGAPELCRN